MTTQVAEVLINPFGDDDDDFDCNHIVDSNYERSRAIVMEEQEDQEDQEEDDQLPETLPHTLQSFKHLEVKLLLKIIFIGIFSNLSHWTCGESVHHDYDSFRNSLLSTGWTSA